jgi:enoyl-CoA hydratase/carnithine racemase
MHEERAAPRAPIDIAVERDVARLTLQRPEKRNAITAEMWDAMIEGLSELGQMPALRALVVSGAGGSFSAGADLASVKNPDGSLSTQFNETALRGIAAIREFPHTTLALIDGPCFGAGCSIALACDVRFASPASIFSIPAVRYGIPYDEGSLRRLVELVGSGQASRLLFSGMRLSGRDAAQIGLVELCSDDLSAEGEAYVSALQSADVAMMSATRESIRRFAGLETTTEYAPS